nr:pyrroline-5-carboxylate reductase dimerization domain-containing protein [Janibacter sp. YB324]
MTRADALALAGQAARGAGAMLVETGEEAALLRAQVTSPGGSTAAALARLEAHGLRHALADAVSACADRAG